VKKNQIVAPADMIAIGDAVLGFSYVAYTDINLLSTVARTSFFSMWRPVL
jgi:hypothetical protein